MTFLRILTWGYRAFWTLSGAKSRNQSNPKHERNNNNYYYYILQLVCYPVAPKARQLDICESVALKRHTLPHPVIYQDTIKFSPKSEDNWVYFINIK